jgi:hypothetical protein
MSQDRSHVRSPSDDAARPAPSRRGPDRLGRASDAADRSCGSSDLTDTCRTPGAGRFGHGPGDRDRSVHRPRAIAKDARVGRRRSSCLRRRAVAGSQPHVQAEICPDDRLADPRTHRQARLQARSTHRHDRRQDVFGPVLAHRRRTPASIARARARPWFKTDPRWTGPGGRSFTGGNAIWAGLPANRECSPPIRRAANSAVYRVGPYSPGPGQAWAPTGSTTPAERFPRWFRAIP